MKLNNKGFAITGILYSLFVVFLLVLLSVLKGLQARRTFLENSLLGLEKTYQGKKVEDITEVQNSHIANVTGKYIFTLESDDGMEYSFSSYLKKGDKIDKSMTLISKDNNTYTYSFWYEEDNSPNKLNLIEIYSFEE